MPELPDVEVFKRYYERKAQGKFVSEVRPKDDKVLGNVSAASLRERIPENRTGKSSRHGKHLFVEMSGKFWLAFHFGMTGYFCFYREDEPPSDHPRLIFDFEEGSHLAFDCQRRLGEINLIGDKKDFVESKGLGPDALNADLSLDDFKEVFSGSRAMAKSALMDQSKLAGVGNIYADEILFQAGVHPREKCSDLSDEEFKEIYEQMARVLEQAIDAEVKPDKMPEDFLLPHREPGGRCPKCSKEVEKVKVSGRGSYFCPSCQ